jgi:protocatechuate 3,4-dioxygenase beta subunit
MVTLAGTLPRRAAAALCGVTGQTTAGPFYVTDAPALLDLNRLAMPGTPMRVSGTVTGGRDGQQPITDALVEIWHCDADGHYHPEGSGRLGDYPGHAINLRGVARTDGDGRFAFVSIVPGHYGNRRRHIHWRVVAPGHRPLTTQSYWLDEKGTARERSDFVDRNIDACRWVRFETDRAGSAIGRFDVVLEMLA